MTASSLSTPTISPANPSIDQGQSLTITASWTGGTPTYGASLYSSSTSTCNQQSTLIQQDIGLTSTSVTFSAVSPTSSTYYCVFVTENTLISSSVAGALTNGFKVPAGMAFVDSGTYAYVINQTGGTLAIVDMVTNTVSGLLNAGFSTPQQISVSPTSGYAYVTNYGSSNIVIVNTTTNTITGTIKAGLSSPGGGAIAPSGTYAYVTNFATNNMVIVNTATNSVVNSINSGFSGPAAVSFSPDGSYAYVANYNSNNVVIINTSTNTITGSITGSFDGPYAPAISPSGSYAYVTNAKSNNVVIINTATNTVVGYLTSGINKPYGVTFSLNGTYAYVSNYAASNALIVNTGVQTANSITSKITVNAALAAHAFTPIPAYTDSGIPIMLTVSLIYHKGTAPYTFKWYTGPAGNSCSQDSGNLIATYSGITLSMNSVTVTPTTSNSYCTVVTDSAYSPETASSPNSVVTVSPALSSIAISPSNPQILTGNAITLSASWTGGTPTYGASLYSSSTSTCNQQSTLIEQEAGLSTNSVTFSSVTPASSTYYCVYVTDNTPNSYEIAGKIASGFSGADPVSFSPSGTYAYVANDGSNNVVIINTASNTVTGSINSGFAKPEGMAISPDGSYAYVANWNGNNVVIINTASNTVTGSIAQPAFGSPDGAAFSPSGTFAYIANYWGTETSGSGNVVIVNTATNTITGSIDSGFASPTGIAFSPDGSYSYVVEYGGTVSILSSATNAITGSVPGVCTGPAIDFSPSGTYSYTTTGGCNGNTSVTMINTATNTIVGNLYSTVFDNSSNSGPYGVAFSPTGKYAYVTNNNNVIILNTYAATVNHTVEAITYNALTTPTLTASPASSVSAGQSEKFTATWSGGIGPYTANYQIFNTATNAVIANALYTGISGTSNTFSWAVPSAYAGNTISANVTITDSVSTPETANSANVASITITNELVAGTLSPSNPTISAGQSVTFSMSWSGGTPTYGASLYSSTTSTCNQQSTLIQQDIGLSSTSVTFSAVTPSSKTYYCVFVTDNTLSSYSIANSITTDINWPAGVAFSPSGTYAYVTNHAGDENVLIINTATNTVTGVITTSFLQPFGVAFSPDGSYAYFANEYGNTVSIINTATNTVVNTISSGFGSPFGVAFSPTGKFAYVTNYGSSNIVIINTASNTVTGSLTSGFNYPDGISFSPSGSYAYVTNYAGVSNTVIINTSTNSILGSIQYGFNNPTGVAFSPSGTYAYVTNYGSNNVVIINTATNTVTASINSGFNTPEQVAIAPSGTYAYVTNYGSNNVIIINTGVQTINSTNSYVSFQSSSNHVTNPYAGGTTGFHGTLPGTTSSTTTVATTSTTTLPAGKPIIQSSGKAPVQICNDTSGYSVVYPSLTSTLHISSGITGCFNITATNVTSKYQTLNRSIIAAINYAASNKNVSTAITMHYPCSTPSSNIAPFVMRNDTWKEITPFTINASACTVAFAVPSDPVIAIFNTQTSNSTTSVTVNSTTTALQSTVSTAPQVQQQSSSSLLWVALIIIIIIIAALLYLRSRK